MAECAVCLESKSKKSLQQVGDSVEHLIKKHVHESYNKELAAHSSHICSTCRRHLFNLDKGQDVSLPWINKVKGLHYEARRSGPKSDIILEKSVPVNPSSVLCSNCYQIVGK